jgi:hypothetical protein
MTTLVRIIKHEPAKVPKRASENLRPKLGSVASVLAQSKIVSDAFGRAAGFVLMMTGLFVVLSVNLTAIIVVSKGVAIAFR